MSDTNIQNATPVEVAKPFSMSIEGVPHIAVPKDFVVHPAENLLDHPPRDIRIVSVIDADSFKSYLDIHKTDRAAVHVNSQWPSANSSDYLACGYCDDADNVVTSWRDHQVKLDPLLSKDFVEWRDIDGKDLSQIELCRFLDRHLSNIVRPDDQPKAPTSSEVLTFVSNLSDVKKVEFKKSVNLDNGRVQLTYNELDADGGTANISVPRDFWIQLRPIVGRNDRYNVLATMRYRIVDSTKLVFTIELRDLDILLEEMRDEMVKELREKVAPIPVFLTR